MSDVEPQPPSTTTHPPAAEPTAELRRTLLSHFQFNPLGSFFAFASPNDPLPPLSSTSKDSAMTHSSGAEDSALAATQVPTPTPTRPSTPRPSRFPAVKNIITGFSSRGSRSQQPVRIAVVHTQVQTEEQLRGEGDDAALSTPTIVSECTALGDTRLADDVSYESSLEGTPPLTPESLVSEIGSLSPVSQDVEMGYGYSDEEYMHEDEEISMRPHSQEIKAGKKPARPIDYDTLLDDISVEPENTNVGTGVLAEDADEWYGLEYTLELSTRERRASETPAVSTGEHSKSVESWLAMHEGTVHPFYEDEEFSQWKDWHRYLDRQDEKRRHRRGRAFKQYAKEAAWVYLDEMQTRDFIHWQEETYGQVDRDLMERLELLDAHRPDPYYPPQKHNRAWHLKRSRSVAALCELHPSFEMMPCFFSCEV
ncbi:hypothetical protein C8F01DRAFT_1116061 [Mycena amicta]|nr:hypothetical protein C8F01DRAFT_1116061 [Mycena amicta]